MSICWPFTTKVGDGTEGAQNDPATQWRRIDQGQDLQGLGPGEEACLAITSGTVSYAHDPADPNNPGAHFGDPYPVLHADGGGAFYYGHTHPTVAERTHVTQGQQMAVTSSPGGGLTPDHWLELGIWGPNGPTGDGQSMHALLLNAPVFAPVVYPPITTTTEEFQNVNITAVHSAVNLDANGDGYADVAVIPDASKVLSVMFTMQDPPTQGYHKVPQVGPRQEGGITRLVFVEGEPNVQFTFTAFVLA